MKVYLLMIGVVYLSTGMIYSSQVTQNKLTKPATLTDLPQLPLMNIAQYLKNADLII